MYELIAELPDKVIEKGADKLFDQGVLGVMLVVFIAAAVFATWKLIDCHKTHAQVAQANATSIAQNAAAQTQVAGAIEDGNKRLELIERRLEMIERKGAS